IYKETTVSNMFFKVDSVPYDSLSVYLDMNSNPRTRAYRYRISAVDNCGNESELSPTHKTLHLAVNQGLGIDINLMWDFYEGFWYGTFYIHRHLNATGWVIIDSIPANLTSYLDTVTDREGLYYQIGVAKFGGTCLASKTDVSGGPYSQSLSNLDDTYSIDTKVETVTVDGIDATIFPNPFSKSTTVMLDLPKSSEIDLQVYDLLGNKVHQFNQKINIPGRWKYELGEPTGMKSMGTYIAVIRVNGEVISMRLVKM
ncbi:MAG: T9SS type A sorting domain-containing protein, partial [Bacteroidetes bacterium]|nr:T9SS type A sorting domain-containing protein [Bacteroidota bacterium]